MTSNFNTRCFFFTQPFACEGYNHERSNTLLYVPTVNPNTYTANMFSPQTRDAAGNYIQYLNDNPNCYIKTSGNLRAKNINASPLCQSVIPGGQSYIYFQTTNKQEWYLEFGGISGHLTSLQIRYWGDYAVQYWNICHNVNLEPDDSRQYTHMRRPWSAGASTYTFVDPSITEVRILNKLVIWFLDVNSCGGDYPAPLIYQVRFTFKETK